jgi:hypothetical protein
VRRRARARGGVIRRRVIDATKEIHVTLATILMLCLLSPVLILQILLIMKISPPFTVSLIGEIVLIAALSLQLGHVVALPIPIIAACIGTVSAGFTLFVAVKEGEPWLRGIAVVDLLAVGILVLRAIGVGA